MSSEKSTQREGSETTQFTTKIGGGWLCNEMYCIGVDSPTEERKAEIEEE